MLRSKEIKEEKKNNLENKHRVALDKLIVTAIDWGWQREKIQSKANKEVRVKFFQCKKELDLIKKDLIERVVYNTEIKEFTDKQIFEELLKRIDLNDVDFSKQHDAGVKNNIVEIGGYYSTQTKVEFNQDGSFKKLEIKNYP